MQRNIVIEFDSVAQAITAYQSPPAASLLHGLGVVSLGPAGWPWLGVVAVAGAAVLMVVPERIWGRYAAARAFRRR